MSNYNRALEARESLRNCLTVYLDMLGQQNPEKAEGYGFVPGLNMSSEADGLDERRRKLSEGIFQVMFTGGFSAGKSTLLNALMGKDLLRTSINPETAVITKIIFQQKEAVIIYYKQVDENGEPVTETMSTEEFFERFRVSQENPRLFENVDYVIIKQAEDGIAGGLVQLVDSPGTENSEADTMASRNFLTKADAVVHLINSTMAFQDSDKDYIAEHYEGKHMKNLFFVCNRFDSLSRKEKADLKARVRKELEPVFLDEKGVFDQQLFESRVFYTDSYHALAARCPAFAREEDIDYPVDEAATNIPDFEKALGSYLSDDERDVEAFKSYLNQLAVKFVRAKEKIRSQLQSMKAGVDAMKADRDALKSSKEKLEEYLEMLETCCRTCLKDMVNSAAAEYDATIQRINSGWDARFEGNNIRFSFIDMVRLARSQRKGDRAKLEKLMKPFQSAISAYVQDEMQTATENLSSVFEQHLRMLETQIRLIEAQIEELHLPVSTGGIREALIDAIDGSVDIQPGELAHANLFQIILGMLGGDIEGVAEGLKGTQRNGDAIVKFIVRNVIDYAAINLVAWPIGVTILAVRFIVGLKDIKDASMDRAAQILQSMKPGVIGDMGKEKEKYVMQIENLLSPVLRAGKDGAAVLRGKVNDFELDLDDMIQGLEKEQCSYDSEKARTDQITEKLLSSLGKAYETIHGQKLTEKQVYAMAGEKFPAA